MQAQMRNGGRAAYATAMNQLANPNATEAQREAARLMVANFQGQQAVDFNEHYARERIAMHGANAARDVRIAAQQREGNMKPPEQKPMEAVPDALTTIPAGSDYEGAVTHVAAHMEQAGLDATSAEVNAHNIVEAQMWNDAKNRRIPANSWQMGKLRQLIQGVDPATGRVGTAMKKPVFMELARARGIGPQQAAEIYDAATNAVPNNQAPVGI
jgi:hypothetical protein